MVVVVVVAFYHLFFYWQYTHLPTKFFFWLGCLLALPPPPLRPCWPKMIKCHQSTTPRRRAWPGMLPRFARPGRGGPSFWGGGLVTLNHFWPARSGKNLVMDTGAPRPAFVSCWNKCFFFYSFIATLLRGVLWSKPQINLSEGHPDREKSFNLSPRDLEPSLLNAGQIWHLDLCVTLGV